VLTSLAAMLGRGSTKVNTPRGEQKLATVELRPGESQESLLKRFRKEITKSGILGAVRRKRWYISKSEIRRIQKKKAIRRARRRETKRQDRGR
jgi:small subunit ribosomal protein S21